MFRINDPLDKKKKKKKNLSQIHIHRSVGGAGVQFPGLTGIFRVRISRAHALRLISRAGKEGSTVSSIICDRWLILS